MESKAKTVEEYLDNLLEDKKESIKKLRKTILENIPQGFEETMSYGMPSFVVPHSIYPEGYHCNPLQALPFLSYDLKKNGINIYHIGMYADKSIMDWFLDEYPHYVFTKPNIGKNYIRFKSPDQIPYELIAELVSKVSVQDWIELYESVYVNKVI